MKDDDVIKLSQWLHELEEGNITEADRASMERLILDNPEARRMAVERLHLSASLCHLADEAQEAAGTADNPQPKPKATVWPALAMAASIVLMGLIGAQLWLVRSDEKPESRDAGCAVLVEAINTRWANAAGPMQTGRTLPAGKLKLEAGVARIEFYSGASMTLKGPCEVDLVSESAVRCARGELRVRVPQHAHGFTVSSPDCSIVDLGTEFGLRVSDTSSSEMHVFEGEVRVTPASTEPLNLKEGSGWVAGKGQVASASGVRSSFVDIEAMRGVSLDADAQRLAHWKNGMTQWATDPRALIAYTFETNQDWDRTLRNMVPGNPSETNGSIVGAHWVKGRWQGKLGLDFRSVGDRVRLTVPGKYDAVTLSAWVRIGGLDRRYNSLLLSDGWNVGKLHWQIHQTGYAIMGVRDGRALAGVHSLPVVDAAHLGMWYHFAMTVDLRNRFARHYVNGTQVWESKESHELTGLMVDIGNAQLGNWNPSGPGSSEMTVRNFTGVMDEFLFFKEALKPDEISRIYELGRPD